LGIRSSSAGLHARRLLAPAVYHADLSSSGAHRRERARESGTPVCVGVALRQEELLVAYLMAVISNTFAGHDMLQNLFGHMTHPYYFAGAEQLAGAVIERLPKFLFVSDEEA
jgi:hypothetical protein